MTSTPGATSAPPSTGAKSDLDQLEESSRISVTQPKPQVVQITVKSSVALRRWRKIARAADARGNPPRDWNRREHGCLDEDFARSNLCTPVRGV